MIRTKCAEDCGAEALPRHEGFSAAKELAQKNAELRAFAIGRRIELLIAEREAQHDADEETSYGGRVARE